MSAHSEETADILFSIRAIYHVSQHGKTSAAHVLTL